MSHGLTLHRTKTNCGNPSPTADGESIGLIAWHRQRFTSKPPGSVDGFLCARGIAFGFPNCCVFGMLRFFKEFDIGVDDQLKQFGVGCFGA